jgi:hypothetical protein
MTTNKKTLIATAIAGVLASSVTHAFDRFDRKDITAVGWTVSCVDSSYDVVSGTTTLFYDVSVAAAEKDLSHWVLALEDAPVASSGCSVTPFGLDPTTGVYGWKCDIQQDKGTTQQYSITLNGQTGAFRTDYAVKGGTYFAVGSTQCPGDAVVDTTTYSIAGTAYVDANGNGSMDAGEPRLPGVTVTLNDGQSARTDANGGYRFDELMFGGYQVGIPQQTPEIVDDFNEDLVEYFDPTTSTVLNVSVGPDTLNENFGFDLDTQAVMADLNSSDPDADGFTFTGTGKTIGFWKHQVSSAKANKTKGVQVSSNTVKDYLYGGTSSIKNMFIDVFADMPTGTPSAYDYALGVLESTSSNEVALLKKQLMATELNHQAGWGLAEGLALQGSVLAWSEYLVKNATNYTRDELLFAKDILDTINNLK